MVDRAPRSARSLENGGERGRLVSVRRQQHDRRLDHLVADSRCHRRPLALWRLDYDDHHSPGVVRQRTRDKRGSTMPMIDIYATAGTFADSTRSRARRPRYGEARRAGTRHPDVPQQHRGLHPRAARRLALERRRRPTTCACRCSPMPARSIAISSSPSSRQLTDLVAPTRRATHLVERTWVLLTEAVPGGWGLVGSLTRTTSW